MARKRYTEEQIIAVLNGAETGARAGDPLDALGNEDEEQILLDANTWVIDQGLPEGELGYEIAHMSTGESLAILDLAWPNGLQEGYSQPVALLIDEDARVEESLRPILYRRGLAEDIYQRPDTGYKWGGCLSPTESLETRYWPQMSRLLSSHRVLRDQILATKWGVCLASIESLETRYWPQMGRLFSSHRVL